MKYIKCFEDYNDNFEKVSNAYGISDDPVIQEIMKHVDRINSPCFFEYEIAEAVYQYIQNNDKNTPCILYLKRLLAKIGYKGKDIRTGDIDDIYYALSITDINKLILESYKIINYIKNNDIEFFEYLEIYKKENDINLASDMGELGF